MRPNSYGDLLGKTLLIGVTYVNDHEEIIEQQQWWGTVTQASVEDGIVVELRNSSAPCVLPPELHAIQPAEPGNYRLRSTGEVIVNPDYLTTWTCRQAEEWMDGSGPFPPIKPRVHRGGN